MWLLHESDNIPPLPTTDESSSSSYWTTSSTTTSNNNNNNSINSKNCYRNKSSPTPICYKELKFKMLQNSNYLLRRCLDYDWLGVEVCCTIIITIFQQQQQQQQQSLQSNKKKKTKKKKDKQLQHESIMMTNQLLHAIDDWGNTPLHAVCHFKPPVVIIRLLFEAISLIPTNCCEHYTNPEQLQLHFKRNIYMETPLLIACRSGCSLAVIQELLYPLRKQRKQRNHYQQDNNINTTRNVLLPGGSMVLVSDCNGKSPFTELISRYEIYSKVPKYQTTFIPLEHVFTTTTTNKEEQEQPQEDNYVSLSSSSRIETKCFDNPYSSSCSSSSPLFENLWKTINVLLQAAWSSTSTSTWSSMDGNETYCTTREIQISCHQLQRQSFQHSIIHGAAFLSAACPIKLIDLVLRSYYNASSNNDNDASSSEKKKKKMEILVSPLHLAILNPTIQSSSSSSSTQEKQKQQQQHSLQLYQQRYFIDRLLELELEFNSSSSSSILLQSIPGTYGRTPFLQAIASGLQWHIPTTGVVPSSSSSSTSSTLLHQSSSAAAAAAAATDEEEREGRMSHVECGPLQSLWNYAPQTLYDIDPITGLPPCLLAATAASIQVNDKDEDIFQLDTIYNLLRLDPQQISFY